MHKSTLIQLILTVYLVLRYSAVSQSGGFSYTLYNTAAREVLLTFVLRFLGTVFPFTCNVCCKMAEINLPQKGTLLQVMSVLLVIRPQMSDSAESPSLVSGAVYCKGWLVQCASLFGADRLSAENWVCTILLQEQNTLVSGFIRAKKIYVFNINWRWFLPLKWK